MTRLFDEDGWGTRSHGAVSTQIKQALKPFFRDTEYDLTDLRAVVAEAGVQLSRETREYRRQLNRQRTYAQEIDAEDTEIT